MSFVQRHWRAFVSRLALPMLALAASYGVYHFARFFVPEWVAMVQAASFEMTYIGLAINQAFDPDQRRRAVKISVGAVAVSIIYNSLSGFFTTQPHVLEQLPWAAWALLAVLHGAPLAWVAYLVSDLLLHSGNGRWILLRIKEWQCAVREQWIETLEHQLLSVRRELAEAVQAAQESTQLRAEAVHWRAEAERLRTERAQRRDVPVQPLLITKRDVVQCWERLCNAGQSERDAAQQMGINPNTLRSWQQELVQAAQNGKEVHV